MRYYAERSEAKNGGAKCNYRTAYNCVMRPDEVRGECNVVER